MKSDQGEAGEHVIVSSRMARLNVKEHYMTYEQKELAYSFSIIYSRCMIRQTHHEEKDHEFP